MRRMILPLMLLLAIACQPATMELTDAERATIADEVTAIQTQFWNDWEAVNFDAAMAYYRTNPDPVWAWMGEVRSGVEDLTALFRGILEGLARQELTVDDRQVVVLGQDAAYVIDRISFSAFDAEGAEAMSGRFVASVVWVRSNGEWKVAGGHESIPLPEVE